MESSGSTASSAGVSITSSLNCLRSTSSRVGRNYGGNLRLVLPNKLAYVQLYTVA